jgi:hypothetical protein
VRQRFDLAGDAKICVPMVVDLQARRALWTDVTLGTTGAGHNVWRYRAAIARAGRDLTDVFVPPDEYTPAGRATIRDLACWTAAARTDGEVCVRGRAGGELWAYRAARRPAGYPGGGHRHGVPPLPGSVRRGRGHHARDGGRPGRRARRWNHRRDQRRAHCR